MRACLLAIAGIVLALGVACGQDEKPKDPLFKGRLPAYYGDIVTEAQRQQIYAVQEKYDKQISALEEQLEALKQKRELEMKAVLTEEQRAKLKRVQENVAAKRKKASEKKSGAK